MKLATRETIEKRYVETFKTGNVDKEGKPVKVNSKSITKLELIEVYIDMANKQGKLKPETVYFTQSNEQKSRQSATAASARSASRGPFPPTYAEPPEGYDPATMGRGRGSSRPPPASGSSSSSSKA